MTAPLLLINRSILTNQQSILEKKFLAAPDITQLTHDGLSNFEIDNIPLVPLLHQTGYITIVDYDEQKRTFKVNFPNYEVEESFIRFLVNTLSNINPGVMDSAL